MPNILSSDFPISTGAYLSFDGLSIKELIRQRLNQTGQFSDQNFEGSNISAWNDAIAMIFSLLLYNLNKTANEGMFTEAQVYENVSRIVKQLDYKPIGHQTATLSYGMTVENLALGTYTIPRFSYVSLGGIKYSIPEDLSFSKTVDNVSEQITNLGDASLLYQGSFIEYPTQTASGTENELIFLSTASTDVVDNFNFHVYVKSGNGKWTRWAKTQSLFLNNAKDTVFELRFNENQKYEIKFGNGINGAKLTEGDSVAVYYLLSDGQPGEVGANILNTRKLVSLDSIRLNSILSDTSQEVYLSSDDMNNITLSNTCKSTYYTTPESVTQIKQNAPGSFRSQFAIVTPNGYETFIKTNFANIVQDVTCYNNSQYLDNYIKYFYDLGLTRPQLESRAAFNQVKMADACNFNNVYLFVVPKSIANNLSYINAAQKSLIIQTIKEEKVLTSETVLMDPVYLAVDFALSNSNTTLLTDIPQTEIYVQKTSSNRRNDSSITNDVANTIATYFAGKNLSLGQTLDVLQLTTNLLAIDGVKKIFTRRKDTGLLVDGLRLLVWNPLYGDISSAVVAGNKTLETFQFPYLYTSDLLKRIKIEDNFSNYEGINY